MAVLGGSRHGRGAVHFVYGWLVAIAAGNSAPQEVVANDAAESVDAIALEFRCKVVVPTVCVANFASL